MGVFVRCARCSYQAELATSDGTGACPNCGARLEVVASKGSAREAGTTSGGVAASTPEVTGGRTAPVPSSPKSRMLERVERIALDADGVGRDMREAMATCIEEIRDGSRTPAGELGALLDAGRSYAVASFGIWNELRSRSEALEKGTPACRRAELVADEALCAGDAGVIAAIRAIDAVLSHGQRLEPVELEALVNLWQTVHDFDRYPLAALRMKCLQHGYGLFEGEGDPKELSARDAELALYDVYECAEAGAAEGVLSICEDVLKALPDNIYAKIMAEVARQVIACDTVLATTHFHDLDEAVQERVIELRGEPFKRIVPAVQADGSDAEQDVDAEKGPGTDPEKGAGADPAADAGEEQAGGGLMDFLRSLGPDDYEDIFDYEIDEENLLKRSQGLRDLAVCLKGMVKGIGEHTGRVLEDCEAGRIGLSEEVVASVRAQHEDAAGALSLWLRTITREMEDMLALGLQFEEDWEAACWKQIFLSVAEEHRDRLWHLSYEDLRREFETSVESLEFQEADIHHRIADVEIALDRKMREIERAHAGDPAVLERLRAEAGALEYDLAMLMITLEYVQDCYETRDWDDLDETDC